MVNVVAPFGIQKWEIGSKEDSKIRRSLTLKAKISMGIAAVLSVLIITLVLVCTVMPRSEQEYWFPEYNSPSRLGRYPHAAVSTDAAPCAPIGREMLEKGGSAVDAAIAVLLCMGAYTPQSMGLGGGFLMIYYNRSEQAAYYIDAREVAPLQSHKDMFLGKASLASLGSLSIAVPGEVAGYVTAHNHFGKLPWEDLFPPTIKMCREGIPVSPHLARALAKKEKHIYKYKHLRNVFTNSTTGEILQLDDIVYRPELANTLELIAREKSKAFYGPSELASSILKDLKDAGSIIQEEDMMKYSPKLREPSRVTLRDNVTLYSSSTPGSGALLAFILQVLDGYKEIDADVSRSRPKAVRTLHRMIETFKFAYAKRMYLEDSESDEMEELVRKLMSVQYADEVRSKIDDERTFDDVDHYGFNVTVLEDHGTSHMSVVAPNGDAVSVTSTVNAYFGSMVMSPSTGILFNNEMDDFSAPNITNSFGVPPVPYNHIYPGRRPFSSMCPSILVDAKGDVRLTLGGNGGTQITTSVAQVIVRNLFMGENIKKSIDAPRFHHQLRPNHIEYEERFPSNLLDDLKKLGHELKLLGSGMLGIIMGIARDDDGFLQANSDYRKRGEVDGF